MCCQHEKYWITYCIILFFSQREQGCRFLSYYYKMSIFLFTYLRNDTDGGKSTWILQGNKKSSYSQAQHTIFRGVSSTYCPAGENAIAKNLSITSELILLYKHIILFLSSMAKINPLEVL